MQRYFCNNKENDLFILSNEDSYHIKTVMRYKVDTEIEIVYDKELFIAKIIEISNNVRAKIVKKIDTLQEKFHVTIAQSIVQEKKMDYILQKSTELGVKEIIPLNVSRSVVKLDHKKDSRIDRWKRVVKEASEQCKRTDIPQIMDIHTIADLIKEDYDIKILCSVNEISKSIKTVLSNIKQSDKILFVIGPEGGFTPSEEDILVKNNFIMASFGNRVLRCETASTFVLSIINYIFMG